MYLYVFNYQTIEILEIEYNRIKSPEDILSEYNLDIDTCQYMSSENKLNVESITKYPKFNKDIEYKIGTKLSTDLGNCVVEFDDDYNCDDCIFNHCTINCCNIKCTNDRQDKQSIKFTKI